MLQAAVAVIAAVMSRRSSKDKHRHLYFGFSVLAGIAMLGLTIAGAVNAKRGSDEAMHNSLGDPDHPPYVAVISLPHITRFLVTNTSNYPAYGIRIRLYDDTAPTGPPIIVHDFVYSDLASHTALMEDQPWYPPDKRNAGTSLRVSPPGTALPPKRCFSCTTRTINGHALFASCEA